MSVLEDKVLVLNRNWQAIDVTNVQTALCDIVRGVATAMNTDEMSPVTWQEWFALPVRENDKSLGRTDGSRVRVPTVIVKGSYAKVPKRRPKLDRNGIAVRDGKVCQYTGKYSPDGNVDHVVPVSRGGKSRAWTNMVWSARDVNARKGNRMNHEVGLRLLRSPKEPVALPATVLIKRRADKPDWDNFLIT